jgi:TonB family protein
MRSRLLAGLVLLAVAVRAVPARAQPAAGVGPEDAPKTIVPPKLTRFVEAEFPKSEMAAGKGATVVLQISITATGSVAEVVVVQSAGPAFDAPAVAAAKQFVFEPAKANGVPIPVKITYRYLFKFEEKIVKKTTADFEGHVRDRATKKPMANVGVSLDSGQKTITDEQGKFSIADVPPGERTVTLSGEELATVFTTETFEVAKKVDATYEVEPRKSKKEGEEEEEEIVVRAPRIKKQVVSTSVAAEQAKLVPGTGGDVLKVVENLPGVARAAVGSGALVVWGAAPQDTRVYIEGVHVPRLYHDGGYRSIVSSDFVKSVELVPGAYGAGYGRGIGGLVTVSLKPLDDEGIHGSAAADTIDASASVRAKVADHLHVAIAARKSYLDTVLNAVTSEDVGQIIPIPRYWDGQARIAYDFGPLETVEIGGLISSDRTTRNLVNPDPAFSTSQTTGTDFNRVWIKYEKHLPDGAVIEAIPSYGTNSTSLVNLYGSTPTDLTNDSDVYAFRATWRGPVTPFLRGYVGIDAEITSSTLHRDGSIGAPPREGDKYVFGQPPPTQINFDNWNTVLSTVGAFAEGDFGFFDDKLHVVPGGRFEPFVTSASKMQPTTPGNPDVNTTREDAVIEPRLSIRYAFSPRITAKAAYGELHQAPQPEELSAIFGTPTLGLESAKHYLAGSNIQLTETLAVEATAFYSESQDLVVRTQAQSPFVAQVLAQTGVGRSYGTQFLLRQQQLGRFFGWISYSIMRSERKDAPNLDWRLFDYDQTHVFTALGSYDLGMGFDVGARFRYATGYPRTPVVGAYYVPSTGLYEPLFGPQNSIRIPEFISLDLRVTKRFKMGKTSAEVYLDVQNVTNHSNPEEIVYSTNFSQRGYITGLPILPVIGARFSW